MTQTGTEVQRTADIRRANLAAVLRHVDLHPGSSQTDLRAALGLATGGVSALVSQLQTLDVLAGDRAAHGGAGRPRRVLRIHAPGRVAVGVEVTVDAVLVRVLAMDGTEIARRDTPLGPVPSSPAELGRLVGERMAAAVPAASTPLTLTVVVPGVVSGDQFTLPAFGWHYRPIAETLATAPDVPVVRLLNDGDTAALGELRRGVLRGCQTAVAIHGSNGIAGGIVSGGDILTGCLGLAGEIGHVIVAPEGPPCECGQRGCLAQVASVRAMARDLDETALLLTQGYWDYAASLAARAEGGEAAVRAVLDEARRTLGTVLQTLGAIVSPERIVLTGNLVPLGKHLLPDPPRPLAAGGLWERPVLLSGFGGDSVLIGAAEDARQAYFDDVVRLSARGA
ncbi:ROK family protein [Pseudonocardia sp. RS11V-5]|uniref:ROK family protein n=1 Tax=Pseudonocardia terrae TaxID=2905831 RepID=UPI001E611BB2|nr:ROK family protein [Pseudonocardia terrae]MCE3555817.1 ROK family protein [Pseudonocardia terrae]